MDDLAVVGRFDESPRVSAIDEFDIAIAGL